MRVTEQGEVLVHARSPHVRERLSQLEDVVVLERQEKDDDDDDVGLQCEVVRRAVLLLGVELQRNAANYFHLVHDLLYAPFARGRALGWGFREGEKMRLWALGVALPPERTVLSVVIVVQGLQ